MTKPFPSTIFFRHKSGGMDRHSQHQLFAAYGDLVLGAACCHGDGRFENVTGAHFMFRNQHWLRESRGPIVFGVLDGDDDWDVALAQFVISEFKTERLFEHVKYRRSYHGRIGEQFQAEVEKQMKATSTVGKLGRGEKWEVWLRKKALEEAFLEINDAMRTSEGAKKLREFARPESLSPSKTSMAKSPSKTGGGILSNIASRFSRSPKVHPSRAAPVPLPSTVTSSEDPASTVSSDWGPSTPRPYRLSPLKTSPRTSPRLSPQTSRSPSPQYPRELGPQTSRGRSPSPLYPRKLGPQTSRSLSPQYPRELRPQTSRSLSPQYPRELERTSETVLECAGGDWQQAANFPVPVHPQPSGEDRSYSYDRYTSAAIGLLTGDTLVFAHVGDCRCLLLNSRTKQPTWLTKDHTEPLDSTRGAASWASRKRTNKITRCFGLHSCEDSTAQPDVGSVELQEDTIVVLASAAFWETDGLLNNCLDYISQELNRASQQDLDLGEVCKKACSNHFRHPHAGTDKTAVIMIIAKKNFFKDNPSPPKVSSFAKKS